MAGSKTVRLYPMRHEHLVPLAVAFVALSVLVLVLSSSGMRTLPAWLFFIVLGLVHAAQMFWLVAVRFDDDAITIIRPWRRRRIAWSRINGTILTVSLRVSVTPSTGAFRIGWAPHQLRLVLDGNEATSSMSVDQARALGPLVLSVSADVLNRRESALLLEVDCWDDVVQELARRGFPSPPRSIWVYKPAR